MRKRSLEAPRLIRRPALAGLPKGGHTKTTIYPWKIPDGFAPAGHRTVPPPLVVHVYGDEAAMRRASRRLEKKWMDRVADGEAFLGMVVPTPRRRHARLAKRKPFAEMFLLQVTLSSEVIAHECVHAATAYLRGLQWARGEGMELSVGACGGWEKEERLAYFAGQLAGDLHRLLVEHRIWSGRP